ncbi:MAG TPA: dTDP-4-dehydrorhamnose 3,5-epimerase [Ilumatobacter sp.]|nr:dTDP-4-dehydrorhamnose 3,5-epimerase [Ilumatobacter sp.]
MGITEQAVRPGAIDGLLIITVKQVSDDRGTVRELFRRSAFLEAGIDIGAFQQINLTRTTQGAIRGMHAEDMDKLLTVATGRALGVYLDLRDDSPTRGKVETYDLEPGVQVFLPRGVANGFQALTAEVEYLYCFDNEWRPGMAGKAACPLDPALGVDWTEPMIVSDKDRNAPTLAEVLS